MIRPKFDQRSCIFLCLKFQVFILGNLILFENKIQKKFFCFVFPFPLVLQYFSYVFVLNIPYFLIAQYLENVCIQMKMFVISVTGKKQRCIHQRRTWISLVSEWVGGWVGGWVSEWGSEWVSECVSEWVLLICSILLMLLEGKFILYKFSL